MKIVGLDYGTSFGMAFVEAKQDIKMADDHNIIVNLQKQMLVTIQDEMKTVENLIAIYRPDVAILEAVPTFSSHKQRQAYDEIWQYLSMAGYEVVVMKDALKPLPPRRIVLISPSTWKPVMRSVKIDPPNSWDFETPHDEDAFKMLYYFVHASYLTPYINLLEKPWTK